MMMMEHEQLMKDLTSELDEIAKCVGVSTFNEMLFFPYSTQAGKHHLAEASEVLRSHGIDLVRVADGVNKRYEITEKKPLRCHETILITEHILHGSTILIVVSELLWRGGHDAE